jgi:enoyl-CoA hydratase/carnithine racemase
MPRTRVLEALEDGVLVLTLNRPERKNSFDETMWREVRDALADALADDAVRAVIVTGAGEAFSAGQDLGQMAARPDDEPPGFPGFMDRLVAFDKPLLAAVNGVGVGIGLTMLLHCDVVWMAEEARLRAPFVPLGVVPEAASSYLLPLQLGHQRAAEMLCGVDDGAGRAGHRDARGAPRAAARDARARRAHRRSCLRCADQADAARRACRRDPRGGSREDAAFAVRTAPENQRCAPSSRSARPTSGRCRQPIARSARCRRIRRLDVAAFGVGLAGGTVARHLAGLGTALVIAVADAAVATLKIGPEAVALRRTRLRLPALWIAAARRALGRHLISCRAHAARLPRSRRRIAFARRCRSAR